MARAAANSDAQHLNRREDCLKMAAALGTQIISVINIATGVMPIDQRANFISTGGFEVGIQIRGPNSESGFMEVLTTGLTSIRASKRSARQWTIH